MWLQTLKSVSMNLLRRSKSTGICVTRLPLARTRNTIPEQASIQHLGSEDRLLPELLVTNLHFQRGVVILPRRGLRSSIGKENGHVLPSDRSCWLPLSSIRGCLDRFWGRSILVQMVRIVQLIKGRSLFPTPVGTIHRYTEAMHLELQNKATGRAPQDLVRCLAELVRHVHSQCPKSQDSRPLSVLTIKTQRI